MLVGFICWIVVGLIVGFIASRIVNIRDEDPKLGLLVGGAAALIGGWVSNAFSIPGAAGFNLWSVMFAGIGALVGLAVWHAVQARIAPVGSKTFRQSN